MESIANPVNIATTSAMSTAHVSLSALTVNDLEKFTLFHDLPTEIRLKIWGFASFVPREVDVCVKIVKTPIDEQEEQEKRPVDEQWNPRQEDVSFASSRSPPAILHVNSESREEALKHYKVISDLRMSFEDPDSFEDPIMCPLPAVEGAPRIYLNPVADRVHFFSPYQQLRFNGSDDTSLFIGAMRAVAETIQKYKIQRIAVNNGDLLSNHLLDLHGSKLLTAGTGVREVTFCQDGRRAFGRGGEVAMIGVCRNEKGVIKRGCPYKAMIRLEEFYKLDETLWPTFLILRLVAVERS